MPERIAPLRVLQVASGDLWGGAEAQVVELSRALRETYGVSVAAAVLNTGQLAEALATAGVPTTVLDESHLSSVTILQRIRAMIRTVRPAIVHTHRRKENVLGGTAARLCGVPSVRTVHGRMELVEPPLRLDKQAYALLDRWAGKRCQAAVIAVSSELAGSLTQDYPPERICIIRNGISAGYVRMAAVAEPQIPNSGNRIRLAYLGRLVPVKRVDRLIQAFRILLNCAPDEFALFIIGDGPERDALIRLAERLGVSANVHFLGHRADPHACLGRMEIVLLASEHEGLPMAALEALSLGIMPVVPPVGGLPELLEAAQFGKIAKSSSPEDLAAAVLDGAASVRPCSAFSRLPERWSIEYSAQMHIQLYRAVLRRDPCPAAAVRELEAR